MSAGVCGLVFLVLGVCAAGRWTLAADEMTHRLMREVDIASARPLMRGLTYLGSGYSIIPMAVIACFLIRPLQPTSAVLIPMLTAGGIVVDAVLKWVIARPRPNSGSFGFPSGHVFLSVVFFGAVLYVVWLFEGGKRWRWGAGVFCGLAVLGIAFSRLSLNAHWLSDVVGGAAGGAAYLLFALALGGRCIRRSDATGHVVSTPA